MQSGSSSRKSGSSKLQTGSSKLQSQSSRVRSDDLCACPRTCARGRRLKHSVQKRCARVRALVRSSLRLCDSPESLCGRPDDLCARPTACARVRAFCAAVRLLVRAELHLCARQTTCAELWHTFCTQLQSGGDTTKSAKTRRACAARASPPPVGRAPRLAQSSRRSRFPALARDPPGASRGVGQAHPFGFCRPSAPLGAIVPA
jgi:hypothetical protein